MFQISKKKSAFNSYILSLDSKCNQRCLFYMKSRKIESRKQITYQSVLRQINDAKTSGFNVVDFYGGEPTMYPFLKKAIIFANKIGLSATLATNAIRFSSKQYTDNFFRHCQILGLRVSLHSHRPKIHDKITQVKGNWQKTVTGIKNILVHNKRLSVNVVITSLNYQDLLGIIELINKLGVRGVKLSGLHFYGRILENRYLVIGYPLYKNKVIRALKLAHQLNFLSIEIEKMPENILKEKELSDIKIIYRD